MRWQTDKHRILLSLATLGLVAGGAGWALGLTALRDGAWAGCVAVMLLTLLSDIVARLRRGEAGVDVLALLTMLGALLLSEFLAGAVIAVMLASGRALEEYAARRARGELTALLANAPRSAHRFQGTQLETIAAEAVAAGDRLLVRPGEIIPVDGLLSDTSATLDEAALTGESIPVRRDTGDALRSGAVNAGQAFEMRAIAGAADSTYSGIVRMVEQAQTGKAPFTRLAERYAALFVPLTLGLAGVAWILSGDPVRALAVLVVATPCPLILAAPVAIISGISRAARRGILVKNGGALEAMAAATIVLFDKTGTLTRGSASLGPVECRPGTEPAELLRLAASLDQMSMHVSAQAIVAEARRRGLRLSLPEDVEETPGQGVRGTVERHRLAVGGFGWIEGEAAADDWARGVLRRLSLLGQSGAFVAVDGAIQGALPLADEIRLETPRALRGLRQGGVRRLVMVSGDRVDVAETIANALGIDTVLAESSPADKVAAVETERSGGWTLMIGDGINDAPALAAADVGVAMGARGAAASSEAADAVLMVDRLDRLPEALAIARRSRHIAWQSVVLGMGLSLLAMLVAAAGHLPPVGGAVLQELIDVAAILNALRALGAGREPGRAGHLSPDAMRRLRDEHARLRPLLERIDTTARLLGSPSDGDMRHEVEAIADLLAERLLPHEREDEATLYPRLEPLLRGVDPMAALSRTHREIFHLARLYANLVDQLPPDPLPEYELHELRRMLFSLGAVLRLHFAQEEELFQAISD